MRMRGDKVNEEKRKTLRVNQSNESDLGYIIHGLCGDPLKKKSKFMISKRKVRADFDSFGIEKKGRKKRMIMSELSERQMFFHVLMLNFVPRLTSLIICLKMLRTS